MCANYRPSSREALLAFPLPPPDFAYGEAYPGSVVPIVTNFAPRVWVPACFGLIPAWAQDAKIARSTYNARTETLGEKPSFRDAWTRGQLCIIPAEAIYEPCYESGKAVRCRIERADGRPMGIAGIWERRIKDDGLPSWSMSMLTINADGHPVMGRFHKPEDEKRSVVILPDEAWGDWLRSKSEAVASSMLAMFEPELVRVAADPR
ncbi:MAG: SOS response-associated peptidase family protein [Proteobacteria bacterium]|nr:SOS response-associated peptidase family protein [Pseudomonadota bacterium]